MSLLFLILLPALVYGRIHIEIKTAASENEASVAVTGSVVDIITDRERETFCIQDGPLKDAVRMYSDGRPDDAYVRSPTPWNDLYSSYGWRQVQRILYPRSARILGIKTQPVVVSTQEFINNSTVKVKYIAGVTQDVEDTISNSWSRSGELSVGQEISYSINLGEADFGGSTSLTYTSSWGQETSKTRTLSVGSSSGIEVELEPGQRVIATLTATRGSMDVEVEYVANLDGDVACNYADWFKGHHFWRYDVNEVLKSANLPTSVVSKEIIKIDFYSNAKAKVDDVKTTRTLSMVPMFFHFMNGDLQ